MRYFLAAFFLSVLAVISIFGLRGRQSTRPQIELFPDMYRQAKFHPQAASSLFPDGRTDRPTVPGTVPFITTVQQTYPHLQPRDRFLDDPYLASGVVGRTDQQAPIFGRGFPLSVTHQQMQIGRQNYNIYCAACHGAAGDGQGVTRSYGMIATPTFHDERLRSMPEGEIFNTITHGKNTMGPYGDKLQVEERWAIIAYLRALQLSQQADVGDVPADKRKELGL